jgi:hypothetical protein
MLFAKLSVVRRQAKTKRYLNVALIQGRAHANELMQVINSASVQVRRVSLGVMATMRVSAQGHAQRRRIGYLSSGPK